MNTQETKAAIVTGGGSGMGRATCLALAERGANVLVVDVREEPAQETVSLVADLPGNALSYVADVTDPEDVAGYVAACEREFGGVDGVYNNAGVPGVQSQLEEYPIDEYDNVMAINCRGVFLGIRYAIPAMKRRGGGSIVNVSSQAGLRGVSEIVPYVASKHAVIGLTVGTALEVAPDGIRVNAICPGPIGTPMLDEAERILKQEGRVTWLEKIPMGRYGQADEIAAAATWLLLDAPPFMTGAIVSVDGGLAVV